MLPTTQALSTSQSAKSLISVDAEALQLRLKKNGIGTRPFFVGLHAQPCLNDLNIGINPTGFPNSDHAYCYGCYLPSGLTLTYEKVDIVCKALSEALKE